VTEQDVAEGRYQLTDVVLPMPGFDVQYPANEIAAMYRQLIKDDLGLEEYDWRHPIKYVEALLAARRMSPTAIHYYDKGRLFIGENGD
jgi:tRNA pseudouridine13 synthase